MAFRKKRVYIAYTGGTIGMRKSPSGYVPVAGAFRQQLERLDVFQDPTMPDWQMHEYQPLLDSSNMGPEHWLRIARDIADNYEAYDGFIVLHGTDTMAYTASALPFLLEGLGKPVIVTGSQIALCEVRNDALDNLVASLIIASQYPLPEVALFFGSRLLRGCRAVKVDAFGLQAFDSPNFPHLGTAGVQIEINHELFLPPPSAGRGLRVQPLADARVGMLRLFPGISEEFARNALRAPLKGLVLETFGQGNGPSDNHGLMRAFAEACDRGVVIVNCTQCLHGAVDQQGYAAGHALFETGVVSGQDMTPCAALAKLYALLNRGLAVKAIKRLMQENLKGELTPPRVRA